MIVQIAVALSAQKKCDRSAQTIASDLGFQQWAISVLTIRPHSSRGPGRVGILVTRAMEYRLLTISYFAAFVIFVVHFFHAARGDIHRGSFSPCAEGYAYFRLIRHRVGPIHATAVWI